MIQVFAAVRRLCLECAPFLASEDELIDIEHGLANKNEAVRSRQVPKLTNKCQSTARWIAERGMVEVVIRKGTWWNHMGIEGPTFHCNVEEAVFLAEIGSLVLKSGEHCLSMHDAYMILAIGGCSWDAYLIYSYLRSLGYIVKRHGVEWTLRNAKDTQSTSFGSRDSNTNLERRQEDMHLGPAANGLGMDSTTSCFGSERDDGDVRNTQSKVNTPSIIFDVYSPNTRFKKTIPGTPLFCLCVLRGGCLLARTEIKDLREQIGGLPLKLGSVECGHVSIFSFDEVTLPHLP